jgi:hypothetical protein
VRAFEHLALLQLGLQARTCHHLEVADRLGKQSGDDTARQQANNLAQLYEQARYAPEEETLSPEMMARARHDLCSLAGVGSA